jgi:hypothetical protein
MFVATDKNRRLKLKMRREADLLESGDLEASGKWSRRLERAQVYLLIVFYLLVSNVPTVLPVRASLVAKGSH